MRRLVPAFALLITGPGTLCAQVTPIWSTSESEVIAFDASYARTEHVLMDDGSAFMVAAETSRSGLAGTLHLQANGNFSRGQFGHQPTGGGRLSPEMVLATRGNQVLLAMTELDNRRALVAMVDQAGQLQWARPRFGRQARFFANGDVLLAAGNELMRLKGSNGDLIWVRNLLELRPDPGTVAFQLPVEPGASLALSLHFAEFTAAGNPVFPDPVLVSLDSATGALQWELTRTASSSQVSEACAPVRIGADQVHAYLERGSAQVDAVIERRSGSTGALQWSTRIAAVEFTQEDEACELLATSNLVAFSSRSGALSTLIALNHAGELQWRSTLPSGLPAELRAAPDGALLVAWQQQFPNGLETVAQRRRATDGAALWSVVIPGRAVDWRFQGSHVHLAWSLDDGVSELRLQRRAADTGVLIDAQMAEAEGLALQPADIEFVDAVPYAVLAGLGNDLSGVRVRRLDPASGAVVWSQQFQLAEPAAAVTGASIVASNASRLIAVVYYQIDRSPFLPEPRQALLAIDRSSGSLLWQRAMLRAGLSSAPSGLDAQARSSADGSVYVRSSICINPPNCGSYAPHVYRLSAASGEILWGIPVGSELVGVRGADLITDQSGNSLGLSLYAAATGSTLWSQLAPAGSFTLTALPTANGDLHVLRQTSVQGLQRTHVEQRLGSSGGLSWSLEPGSPTTSVRSPVLSRLADGDLLLSSRITSPPDTSISRPLLARIDGASGAIEWLNTPSVQNHRWLTVRATPGEGPQQWARSLRFVGDSFGDVEERYALTTINMDTGAVGAEHQYAQTYDPPLASPASGPAPVSFIRSDGSALVEARDVDTRGLAMPRLQRWPAMSADRGDLILRQIGNAEPLRALGPSTEVWVEVESSFLASVSGAKLGFASTKDGLKAQLRGCELLAGSGACPTEFGSSLEQLLNLGPGARIRLRYEIHDPGFQPKQARSGPGGRGLFYLDSPYAFGDLDLSNNIAVIQVALGGTSNGFE